MFKLDIPKKLEEDILCPVVYYCYIVSGCFIMRRNDFRYVPLKNITKAL